MCWRASRHFGEKRADGLVAHFTVEVNMMGMLTFPSRKQFLKEAFLLLDQNTLYWRYVSGCY